MDECTKGGFPVKKRLVSFLLALTVLLSLAGGAHALTDLSVYATARFSHYFNCYSGPGTYYYRANEGKATYGGGGVARVYGVAGDWVMIGYQASGGYYRIGYIEKSAMDIIYDVQGTINYNLTFSSVPAWAASDCTLTDDPIINNAAILSIPRGTKMTALGTMGTGWTYVEIMGTSSLMRGFIRSGNVTYTDPGPGTGTPSYPGPAVTSQTGPAPTARPAATAAPQQIPNTYYHDPNKGAYLPSYQIVRFTSGADVYSGPGKTYYRANGGKARMGGGNCRLFGVEGGWALIGYELSSGAYRIGYVDVNTVPRIGLGIPYLDLQYESKTVLYDTYLTDDIYKYYPNLLILHQGTWVTFLGLCQGTEGLWAYVEASSTSGTMRGFIPAAALGY